MMGHGADELFLGYPWLFEAYNLNQLRDSGAHFLYECLPDFRVYFKNINLVAHDSVVAHRWDNFRLNDFSLFPNFSNSNAYQGTLALSSNYWLEPNTLKMGDSLSMNFGLEARHPLLSRDVSFALANQEIISRFSQPKAYMTELLSQKLPLRFLQSQKKYFAPPYMKFYSLIHKTLRDEFRKQSLVVENKYIKEEVYRHLFCGDFDSSALTYYYFAKIATLELWLRSLS